MDDTEAKQWAFIFEQFGKENLRKMLFKAAVNHKDVDRTVIEFDGKQAMNITDHVDELENEI